VEIRSIDHVEMYVADAEVAAARLCGAYGFAAAGRGVRTQGTRSVLLRQREIILLVTSATDPRHRVADYVRRHGDGVAVIGMDVENAEAAFAEAVESGAQAAAQPEELDGGVVFASVLGFGDVEHRFVSRQNPGGPFAPGLIEETEVEAPGLLSKIDHVAVCLPAGQLYESVAFYQRVFHMEQTFAERIIVGSQAMDSKVVQSKSGEVTFTILEPDITKPPGQIDDFVRWHGGAGVQHLAFLTDDIAGAVRLSQDGGVRFLDTPGAYYDALPTRLGDVAVPVDALRELNVLVDRDHFGELFQIFTRSEHPRKTLFYELIDRRGAQTFGSNNIKALYEAVERGQHGGRD